MPSISIKPLTLSLLAVCILTALAWGALATSGHAADKPATVAPKAALTVSLVQAQTKQWPVQLAANGSVAAWQEASVGAEAAGLRVVELHVGVGDSVKRGQLLASFAAETVQADVALARANLNEAQANAAEASANAERARAVQGTGAISAQQVNQYLTQEATAKARVESNKAQLDAQLLRLKQTQLLAPDSGIISARTVSVGTVVAAGTEMFKLIRQARLEWRGEVTASELNRIRPGMEVLLTSPSGVQAKGKVRMLAPTVDTTTRNGWVYVDILTPVTAGQALGAAFKPGMYARGAFNLGSTTALTVPQTAVVVRDGFSYVYSVGADNKVSQRKVQTGRVLGDRIEVQSGVQASDKLVASGGSFLSDGDTVKVVETPANSAVTAIK
ncbi:efflux RND transporter periplasmic adaptor subunit [Curvibacter sp. CHRR-16]|uniref:efflux RND transporter periplasmic adaptor subunit n=1 Tax=Curvibacter sp. CHRR-16 TaxID=2835872 RepID=UPI001BDA83D9|nr:efflux RND transporter periplasmic adaptor subunit [Curvibacter sp. CHRR-16]MBT0571089.1 efflux RND transporter periplasmic adaptor subunit [Curvibacter sp. CHRR-16]